MKSTFLKIIIIIAFVGIISVVGIIIFNNHNVEDKGYNAIVKQNESVDMNLILDRAGNVSASYGGSSDEYASYANNAFRYLNQGINYYFNYLDNVSGMSRNTKDNLVKLNKQYVEQVKVALKKLDVYLTVANKSSASISAAERAQIPALSADFVKEYINAYSKGSEYFKALQNSITQLLYGNYYKDFRCISFEMTNTFVDKSISFVKSNMEKRVKGEAISSLSISTNASNFIKIYNKISTGSCITPSNEQTNSTYAAFIKNYNSIDGVKLIDDYAIYVSTLNNSQKIIAESVKSFLTNSANYNLVIGG